jgi:Ni2+-binding GTPase involved in maturation of urease and hydrogenase
LTTDAGTDVTILVQGTTKLVRIAPGQKDLKDATPIQLLDVQVGDRILVRGKLADDGNSVLAASIVAIKKADIAEKQARDHEEWQKHGAGGLVNSVDPATSTITVFLPASVKRKASRSILGKTPFCVATRRIP